MGDGFDYSRFDEGRRVNYWTLDRTLQRELQRVSTTDEHDWAAPRLTDFGAVVGDSIADNADYIDDHGPELHTYTEHGDVQNLVRYPAEQHENERLAYEAGIVADVFEAPPGRDDPMPFTHYLGLLALLAYAEGAGFTCPVAMTAGAAHVLQTFDDGRLDDYYDALVSRSHDDLVEGAMFLTEEQGGSDVGASETVAEYDEDSGFWHLTGEKWFCSNIDAEGTLALARTPDAPDGTAGLSMFLVPHGHPENGVLTKGRRRDFDGARPPPDAVNDQRYRRLKDKLGTTSVPTGEVELDDTPALLVGDAENGFKQMAEMLNLERLSNAAAACGIVGRCLLESKIHTANREAFGQPIADFPLMQADLVDMAVDYEAATAFTFDAGRLLSERQAAIRNGDGDSESTSRAYRLMRLLTPIAKLRTARMAIDTASYAMEVQGGNGYVNDFVTNRMLRDAQVLPIWEGTENILALDVLRALDREDAHEPFIDLVQDRLDAVTHDDLQDAKAVVEREFGQLGAALMEVASQDDEYAQLQAKTLAHYVFDVHTAALLLAEAQDGLDEGRGRTTAVAQRFVHQELEDDEARGITDGDRFAIEHYDEIVRYEQVPPADQD